ncbi:MAG: type IX secretion system sortase PorU [Weeksellaceae bacterium]
MRILALILIQLLFLSVLNAQIYDVPWEDNLTQHSIGNVYYKVISIQNDNAYNDERNLPHFYHSERVNEHSSFSFKILKEVSIRSDEIGDLQIEHIPLSPVHQIGVFKSRDRLNKVIDIIGIYRDGKEIKKILSFEIMEDSPTNNARIANNNSKTHINPVFDPVNGQFFKIRVDTTGIYKIDKSFLTRHNIPANFDPRKFKIFGNGGMMLPENPGEFRYRGLQEVAIHAVGLEDGSFDEDDYYLFYAQGPNGIIRNPIFPSDQEGQHSKNLYEDQAYYFINIEGVVNGKRIQSLESTQNPSTVFTEFDQVLFYEKDNINLYNVGRLWVGESFFEEQTFNIQFDGNGEVKSPRLSYQMVGVNAQNVSFNFQVNNIDVLKSPFRNGTLRKESGQQDFNSTQYPLHIQINVDNSLNPSAGVYLDYVRLNFKQNLNFNNRPLGFRWFDAVSPYNTYGFRVNGSPEFVWDVSDRTNAVSLISKNDTYVFQTKSSDYPNEFIAFNANQATAPQFVEQVQNQFLTSLSDIDYVIVAYPDFITQAQRLADAHEKLSGVKAAVVTTNQIYNEFSSGSQDISAIRDFFKYLYEVGGSLKYALLLGDSSYDFKDRILNNTNMVPSYQSDYSIGVASSYVSDDFFGILDDSDSGLNLSQLDIAVGRLPADDVQEAEVLINKTLSYLDNQPNFGSPYGDWRTKVTFVVDDDNPGPGNAFHHTVENESAQFIEKEFPFYTVEKLYADAFQQVGTSGGVRYPELEKSIVNAIESGTLLLNYFGHGGVNGWAQERIFTQNHVQGLGNLSREYSRLPIVLTVTCDFTVWDIPEINSGGEMMIKNPDGGAVAMLTTSREIPVSYGLKMNDIVVKNLFTIQDDEYLPVGEALRRSKIEYSASAGLKLNLIGDPLLSMVRPKRQVSIHTINGQAANNYNETIKALDFVSIEGSVLNEIGATDTSFNGNVAGTLFDKEIQKTTLNNDGNIDPLTFTEQNNPIYRGGSKVKDGKFKFEFYVPKDINFDVGMGKMLFYVENGKSDGIGYKNDIKVGDINVNGVDDNEGPVVNLYMNNLNFAPGGITDKSPYLLACVTDSTGINATGAGIGHDITQLLDKNINSTTVLNDFFEGGDASPCLNPKVKDFQKGRVLYKLSDLDLGEHTVTFRVWDINNNSTTQTLDFIVMENGEQQLHINRLLNWPNPFTNQTYFHFEHNCPDVLEVQVQVFTIAGKMVKNIRQTVSSEPFREGYRTGKYAIPWDGLDDFGNKIGKGVYIYKVTVKGTNGETCKGNAEAVEKLVILK